MSELTLVERLDLARGVVTGEFYRVHPESEARSNIVLMAGEIGITLSAQPPESEVEDTVLGVDQASFRSADREYLRNGLIITPGNPLYGKAEANRVAILRSEPVSIFHLPGVQTPITGVALGVGEYQKIAHYPGPLARSMQAKVMDARANEPDQEAARAAAMRGAGHIIENKQKSLQALKKDFLGHIALFDSLKKDARIIWRTSYLKKNLNLRRLEADELLHDYMQLAANNLEYSNGQMRDMHRADTSRRYRNGSARQLAEEWRKSTDWAVYYLQAKLGKVNQSENGCQREIRKYQKHLDAKRQPIQQAA